MHSNEHYFFILWNIEQPEVEWGYILQKTAQIEHNTTISNPYFSSGLHLFSGMNWKDVQLDRWDTELSHQGLCACFCSTLTINMTSDKTFYSVFYEALRLKDVGKGQSIIFLLC